MNSLEAVERLRGRRVLVVGDVMLDEFLRGEVSRISPEAPVPVLEVREREVRLGGAANTAANICALGGTVELVGVVGADADGERVRARLEELGIGVRLVIDASRPTTKKTRLSAQGQQIVRVDDETRRPVGPEIAAALADAILAAIVEVDACVVSDYGKGVITADVAQRTIAAARQHGTPVVVDPKQRDLAIYRGATVVTPNVHELERFAGLSGLAPHEVEPTARGLLASLAGGGLLVTRSADGMTLVRPEAPSIHVPAMAREVYDVTGAGDTVVAAVALALAADVDPAIAVVLASAAASVSVSKRGTSTVSPDELVLALKTSGAA